MDHTTRMALAHEIVERARRAYELRAVALYGSLARGDDGPFSDLELLCVLAGREEEEFTFEWVAGPWKAEVNVVGAGALLREAARIDGRWPLTHGAFLRMRALWDPGDFCRQVQRIVANPPEAQCRAAIEAVLVGELYEFIGKVRNAQARGDRAPLAKLALALADYTAYVLGLARRTPYVSGATLLEEALRVPGRPAGFDALCRLVRDGTLSDATAVIDACEALWAGLEAWAALHGYRIAAAERIPF